MKRHFWIALIGAFLLTSNAKAATQSITQTATISFTAPGSQSGVLQVNQFAPTLGTLTSIVVETSFLSDGFRIGYEHTGSDTSDTLNLQFNRAMSASSTVGLGFFSTSLSVGINFNTNSPPFDGQDDFAGTSGFCFSGGANCQAGVPFLSDATFLPADDPPFSAYVGTGQVVLYSYNFTRSQTLLKTGSWSSIQEDTTTLRVKVTYNYSICGNGVVEESEQCDLGSELNGQSGTCCTSICTFVPINTTCRGSVGACDVAEVCSGTSASCPIDAFASAGTSCGGSDAECDAFDTCNGSGGCVDNVDSTGTVCRPGVNACDVAEACTGNSKSCPVDVGAAATIGCTVNGIPNQPCQGGGNDDIILGTTGNDVIRGGAGGDTLKGNAGDDLLCGEDGDDTLLGATGTDTLVGDQGSDVLKGEAGNDILDGGSEDDTLIGGTGMDQLDGGAGNDKLLGNEDADVLLGDVGNDILNGGDGNDVLDGETDTDDLTGGPGVDTCFNGEKLTTCE